MKKILILLMVLACFTGLADAAMTYGQSNYDKHIGARGTRGQNDPLRNFINEVEDMLDGTGSTTVTNLLFAQVTSDPTATEGRLYYNATSEVFRYRKSGSWANLAAESGTVSLDVAYGNGFSIDVDGTGVTLDNDVGDGTILLILTQDDTTNDPDVISIANASDAATAVSIDIDGTAGFDIQGTSDSWSVSIAGIFDGEGLTGVTNSQDILFDTNNEIQFGDNSEDVAMNFSAANTISWTTDTSVDQMAFGVVDNLTGIENITFDIAEASIITQAGSGNADDLTIRQTGTVDVSLILSSAGSITDALSLITTDAVGVIKISSSDVLDVDAVDHMNFDISGASSDFRVDSAAGSVYLEGAEAVADAIVIDASNAAGGIDVDAGTGGIAIDITGAADFRLDSSAGSIVLVGAEAAIDAITIDAENAAGGIDLDYGTGDFVITGTGVSADFTLDTDLISIDGTGVSNITITGGANEDFTVSVAGAADLSLILASSGTGADALQITTTAGGIQLTNGGASSEDLLIDGVLSAVGINSDEATTDAIDISATLGGITMASNNVASTWTHTANGAGDDLSLIVAGAFDGSIVLTSSGTAANAIDINATAGGIDIDISGAAAGEDFAVTTDSSVTIFTSEAVADQFKVDATGVVVGDAINLETTDGGILLNADGAENGDIQINAADNIELTAAGDLIITNTGTMTVSGVSTLTGAVTATTGVQFLATSREPTADGTGTGAIAAGTSFVTTVDPVQATDWYTLPAAVPGTIIWISTVDDTTGFEIRSSNPATIAINGGSGAGFEAPVPATASLLRLICTNATNWTGTMFDADGDEAKLPAAD